MGLLRDVQIARREIKYHEQTFTVRGICVPDVVAAAMDYGPTLAMAFGKVTSGELETSDVKAVIMSVTKEAPELAGAIIALASDDYAPETVQIATKLPFPVQTEALERVFELTFYGEAEVKKFLESLTRMIVAVSGAMTNLNPSVLQNGIGAFEKI